LGCSLFRLLTGKPPFFDAGSKDAVVQAHLRRAAPQGTSFAPWLPTAMDDVVTRAMAKDPHERYQSARELALAATRALATSR
jgi:serine/threonine protein kinase